MNSAIFSSYYLAPIEFYYHLTQLDNITIDVNEHFVKQTYRSRACILGPNGVQNLLVPLIHVKKRQKVKDIKIAYAESWQKVHWKSLEAGYRRSPYFEYYEDHFYPFFHEEHKYLLDFNNVLQNKVLELIGLEANINFSDNYISDAENAGDFRTTLTPKNKQADLTFPEYIQVFGDRNPFAPNLSIVDLLFNEGPNSLNYLKTIK